LHVVLPLGISFYTFQSIAYIVDVYRGEVAAIRNPLKLALFKAFFPQLIAGPIVRATELVPQFAEKRKANPEQFAEGLDLVAVGLIKKVVIADQIASFADKVFAHPESFSSIVLLLGVYAYSAQIYCDFSGYTDIGRGCAKLLGYELPLNFNFPYVSVNIVDFWRRWHISLSRWLRDYLYIPLGGSRRGKVRTYVNLLITMVLGGLWHGANWTFVAWGALHGIALAMTRLVHDFAKSPAEEPLFQGRLYRTFAVLLTFHLVCVGWVFFRAPTFGVATDVLRGIIIYRRIGAPDLAVFGWITVAVTAASLCAAYAVHVFAHARPVLLTSGRWAVVSRAVLYAVCVIAVTLFAGRGSQQFIYFQF
jgi:D-alanyl-lipoteichoic acid acyltransferase DltB (MBOAT superfamily)